MVALQIRDVPQRVRDELAAAAAEEGVSLQVFLMDVIRRAADSAHNRRLVSEWPIADVSGIDISAIIREGHEERDARILDAVLGVDREP